MSSSDSDQDIVPHCTERKPRVTKAQIEARKTAVSSLARCHQSLVSLSATGEQLTGHRDSQDKFATPGQTIFVYDWDDTLFPTHWVRSERKLHKRKIQESDRALLDQLQQVVIEVLTQSLSLGHVTIVTLARDPWVQVMCDDFYPLVGQFIEAHNIAVVYARTSKDSAEEYDRHKFASSEEILAHWTRKKQGAIMGEISNFYANSNSSWKNIISLGDSNFERKATQMSLTDYATFSPKKSQELPQIGSAETEEAVLSPSTSKSRNPDNHAVSGWVGDHYRRVRCKTIKMFDSPSATDLIRELALLDKWLPYLVARDNGLDIDLEDSEAVYALHDEVTGQETRRD